MGPRIDCDDYETYVRVNLQISEQLNSKHKKQLTIYDFFKEWILFPIYAITNCLNMCERNKEKYKNF